MSALDTLTAHFAAQGRQSWTCPETGLEIWWQPVTPRDQQRIKARAKGSEAAMAAWLVVLKAENADGVPLFDAKDPDTVPTLLSRVDAKVLAGMAGAIMGVDLEDGADDLGNG